MKTRRKFVLEVFHGTVSHTSVSRNENIALTANSDEAKKNIRGKKA